jgi:type IV pilus assembly protein PilA
MKKLSKGFTLIELMIVVAIIGILAAIAIPNFIKYQLRSKFSEAATNVEGLRKAEEALRQGERKVVINGAIDALYTPGSYHNLGAAASLYPAAAATPLTAKIAWTTTELGVVAGIDWQVEGATYFNYQLGAGCATATAAATNAAICYTVGAASDIDGDKVNGEVTLVKVALDGTTVATKPANVGTAFPGTLGSCIDPNSKPVFATPCTLTGPDVF